MNHQKTVLHDELGELKGTEIQFSSWAVPIFLIVKSDDNIRICDNHKLTVNHAAKVDKHLLPKAELLASLARGTKLSYLNLVYAYQQVCLDEVSKYFFTTTNTYHGLFVYNRLLSGV